MMPKLKISELWTIEECQKVMRGLSSKQNYHMKRWHELDMQKSIVRSRMAEIRKPYEHQYKDRVNISQSKIEVKNIDPPFIGRVRNQLDKIIERVSLEGGKETKFHA